MSITLLNPGPIDEFLTTILSDPLLLIVSLILFALICYLIIEVYRSAMRGSERHIALDEAYQYLDELERLRKYDRFRHGQETAQEHIDAWNELQKDKKKFTGTEGTNRIKKWNLTAGTFVKLHQQRSEEEE